jgi:hypothetical protein
VADFSNDPENLDDDGSAGSGFSAPLLDYTTNMSGPALAAAQKVAQEQYMALGRKYQDSANVVQNALGGPKALWDQMTERLKQRQIGPTQSEQLYQLAAALAKPTAYRGFGATLQNVAPVLAQQRAEQRTAADDAYDLANKYALGSANSSVDMAKAAADSAYRQQALAEKYAVSLNRGQRPPSTPASTPVLQLADKLYPGPQNRAKWEDYVIRNSPAGVKSTSNRAAKPADDSGYGAPNPMQGN